MGKKVGELCAEFQDTYGLPKNGDFFSLHDAVHVMTGFGIGLANELRIACVEVLLRRKSGAYDDDTAASLNYTGIMQREKSLYKGAMEWFEGKRIYHPTETRFNEKAFHRAQLCTKPLKWGEIRDLVKLGGKIDDHIKALTGRRYTELHRDEIERLDFSKVDFTRQSASIKRKYLKPENEKAAERSLRVLFNAARKEGRHKAIPAPGSPWHGPLKQTMGAKS